LYDEHEKPSREVFRVYYVEQRTIPESNYASKVEKFDKEV